MSWDYKNVLASPAEHSKNPISNSDTGADGNCPMSDTNHPKGPSTGSGPREYEVPPSSSASSSFLKEVQSKTSAPMSNLVESTRQQHDRNFFQKFLRFPAADGRRFPKDFGHNGFDSNEPCSSTSQQIQPLDQANQFMPQANQSTPLRSSSYSIAPVNFTFGLSHHFEGDTSRDPTENLMMPFYNADDLAGNSMQVYSDMSSISLFDSLNNQSGAIDGSNAHPSYSGNNQSRDQFEARREELGALGKSYSSVLHPVPSAEAAALHMRRQTPNQLSLLEMEQRLSIGNCDFLLERSDIQSMLKPSSENQQNQLTDEPFRTLSQFNPNQRVPTSLPYQVAHPHAKPIKLTGHSNFGKRSSMSDNSGTLSQLETSVVGSQMHETASERGFIHSASGSGMGSAARRRNKSPFFNNNYLGQGQPGYKLDAHGTGVVNSEESERFSRKVFVGGLPPDIDEEEIKASFRRFGALLVDWPHKAESKSYFPPKGYAFLLFQDESSVQSLIDSCFQEEDKLYLCVSSPTIKDKPVQIRPWRLSDSDFVLDSTLTLDPRKTVFVGGVPRPLKASELATIMNNKYGGVCYAGIDTDPELKYPKGAGRVAFSNYQSYIAAISARYVHIHHSEIEKRVEVKPYVLDDQFCDECQGSKRNNKFAPFFCANITCLRYYCDSCWSTVHSQPGREYHKPLVKEGGDRPRAAQSFKW